MKADISGVAGVVWIFCRKCGKEIPSDSRFCPDCGSETLTETPSPTGSSGSEAAALPTRTLEIQTVPESLTEAGSKRRTGLIVAIIAAAVIVLGAAAGLLAWGLSGSKKLTADIVAVELLLSNGKRADLDDVPLDEDLVLKMTVKAKYGEDGEAELSMILRDGAGEEMRREVFNVRSSDEKQTFEDEFYIRWSEGETFEAEVTLVVTERDKEASDAETLEFYVAEGVGAELSFEEAKEETLAKLEEAEDAFVDLIITTSAEAEDLLAKLTGAHAALDEAQTEEEVISIYRTAEEVIAECAARKAAWEEEQARLQEEEQKRQEEAARQQSEAARQAEIAACKKAMFDHAWKQMVTTPFYAEPVRIDGFWMNDSCTAAGGTMVGMKTAHTDPENAGNMVTVPISARKENGQWVAVFEAI